MHLYKPLLPAAAGLVFACTAAGQSVAFSPHTDRMNTNATRWADTAVADGRVSDQYGLSFCLHFGDDIVATAMPSGNAGGDAYLSGGFGGTLSAGDARSAMISWLLGPVPSAGDSASPSEATIWMVQGELNAAMLASGLPAGLPNLGDESRSIGFLRTTDDYRIADGKAVFVPETMRTVVVPLPNACALAAAGLFVLGARRRA